MPVRNKLEAEPLIEADPFAEHKRNAAFYEDVSKDSIKQYNLAADTLNAQRDAIEAAFSGLQEVERSARETRIDLALDELSQERLGICTQPHAETLSLKDTDQDPLEHLGVFPFNKLTRVQSVAEVGHGTSVLCERHNYTLDDFTYGEIQDIRDTRTRQALKESLDGVRGRSIMDALGIPAFEFTPEQSELKRATYPPNIYTGGRPIPQIKVYEPIPKTTV